MSQNDEGKGFSVKDRRIFTEEGEIRTETPEKEDDKQIGKTPEAQRKDEAREGESRKDEREDAVPLPKIDFPAFVLSLHTSALFHFGVLHDPDTGKTVKNLPAAQQTIDILGMLQEKTAGNLDENEQKLIEGVLFELRLMYVKETGKK